MWVFLIKWPVSVCVSSCLARLWPDEPPSAKSFTEMHMTGWNTASPREATKFHVQKIRAAEHVDWLYNTFSKCSHQSSVTSARPRLLRLSLIEPNTL